MNKRGIVFSNIKVDVDEKRIMERVAKNATRAQKALDSQVLKDSNHFVPVYTGTLKKSGIMNTVPGSGKVIWHTPYAKAQYYGDDYDHSKQDNPNACSRWFEAAKARFLKKWRKLIDEYI